MTAPPVPEPLADEHAAFVSGPLSIVAASRDAHNVPSIGRACGCLVAPDRRSVAVFIARTQAPQLVADLDACGQVAVVYTRPSTNRSLQLKGTDARLRALTAAEVAFIARYVEAFGREITPLGHSMEEARTIFRCVDGDLLAIEFTPTAAFVQTPGPGAGTAVGVSG
ncbi:MAG: hypothetical protein U1F10_05760 [Burkholderiales bacterium]